MRIQTYDVHGRCFRLAALTGAEAERLYREASSLSPDEAKALLLETVAIGLRNGGDEEFASITGRELWARFDVPTLIELNSHVLQISGLKADGIAPQTQHRRYPVSFEPRPVTVH